MSQENVEIVKTGIDAFNRGDRDAALKDLAPDFELDMSRAIGPDLRGVYRLDQVGVFLDDIAEPFESFRFEIEEVIGGGRVGGVLPQAPGVLEGGADSAVVVVSG